MKIQVVVNDIITNYCESWFLLVFHEDQSIIVITWVIFGLPLALYTGRWASVVDSVSEIILTNYELRQIISYLCDIFSILVAINVDICYTKFVFL